MNLTPYHDGRVLVWHSSCLDALRNLPDASVDSVVTDPPYGLSKEPDVAEVLKHWLSGDDYQHQGGGFMGKTWDSFVPGPSVWAECLRVLKPGGHLLAFAGSRTQDLMGMSTRLAGFEIRDSIAWLYGSGFPKSMDVSKAIDKALGAERRAVGVSTAGLRSPGFEAKDRGHIKPAGQRDAEFDITAPATPDAERWQGWGTALKPAHEPIVVARKPLVGTVAANVLAHGTGALNVDGCRVGENPGYRYNAARNGTTFHGEQDARTPQTAEKRGAETITSTAGRWPANVVLDESQAAALDEQSGELTSGANPTRRGADKTRDAYGEFAGQEDANPKRGIDKGGASRFFYVAKAPAKERPKVEGLAGHPTVKPLTLMRWLVRLVTPPGGLVLDPFAGSGTTGEACVLEGFNALLIEQEADYLPLIDVRMNRATYTEEPQEQTA